jgi:hypothetical protein
MAKKKQKFSGLADFLDEDQPGQIVVEFNKLDEKTKRTIELQERLTDIPVADRPIDAFKTTLNIDLPAKVEVKKEPVQEPYINRVNTVQYLDSSPVQEPYKYRISENQQLDNTVHQTVYDSVQEP